MSAQINMDEFEKRKIAKSRLLTGNTGMNGMVCESVRFPSLTKSLSVSDAKEKM